MEAGDGITKKLEHGDTMCFHSANKVIKDKVVSRIDEKYIFIISIPRLDGSKFITKDYKPIALEIEVTIWGTVVILFLFLFQHAIYFC